MWPSKYAALAVVASAATGVQAGSLKDIKHIVLFMQENRSFDHYFGTMAGTRNFGDPNVQVNEGIPVWKQKINKPQNGVDQLKYWHLNYLGGTWKEATQCSGAGSNGWDPMHGAWNNGRGDGWAIWDTDRSLGYYKREDVPTHWDVADGWTIMDNSHQSILGVTDPNRVMWMSGTVNSAGSPTNPDGSGGNILSNRATPGCDSPGNNCFPFTWKTVPEHLQEAGISWRVWQGFDNYQDNMLAYFKHYQDTPKGQPLRDLGISFPGLQSFYDACANGTLPSVSYIVGPQEQSEHAPNMPIDGAWLYTKIIDAITSSPAYNETALIVSYDEQGGWADHVIPPVAPRDAVGEWIPDPFNPKKGVLPLGPGPRIPRFVISPWTRGGKVFTEAGDHTSDILFIEEWAKANNYKMNPVGITPWRRKHMTNMVNAFDFENPDYSIPKITRVREPEPLEGEHWSGDLSLGSLTGPWVGPAKCLNGFTHGNYPAVPYGKANLEQNMDSLVEDGYKELRGSMTEGRYLTIENDGLGLTRTKLGNVIAAETLKDHRDIQQRWILHTADGDRFGNTFFLQSAAMDKAYISTKGGLTTNKNEAQAFVINYNAAETAYTLRLKNADSGKFVGFTKKEKPSGRKCRSVGNIEWQQSEVEMFKIYGVNYKA